MGLAEEPAAHPVEADLGRELAVTLAIEGEQELAGLRAEYKQVKETLASAGIQDVLIKSVGLAPSFPYKSDNLDVLYKPQDIEQVKAILRDLGYVELKNVEEPYKYLFRKFHAGRSVSAIHVHAHVGWMVSFLDEETLWRRCQVSLDDALVTVPAADDALLITLAHYFYEDKRVALLDVLKFVHCMRRGVDWDEVYRIARRSYEEGESGYLDLLEAQRTLIETRSGYIESLFSYNVAIAALEKEVGVRLIF